MKNSKILLAATLVLFFSVLTMAQKEKKAEVISDAQWNSLFRALGSEDWPTAYTLSTDLLKRLENAGETKNQANIRYMVLYSVAGKVSTGTMSYDDLGKLVKPLIGKDIATPYRQIKQECKGEFNFICSSDSNRKTMTSAANKTGTSILAFEYAELKEVLDFASGDGKHVTIEGKIKDIVPNPNRSTIVILRIYIFDASISFMDKKPQVAVLKRSR